MKIVGLSGLAPLTSRVTGESGSSVPDPTSWGTPWTPARPPPRSSNVGTASSIRSNRNVPSGGVPVNGNPVISEIGWGGLVDWLGDVKVDPLSVPASYGRRSTVRSSSQTPSSRSDRPWTPTNQSGLGAIMLTSVTSGCSDPMVKVRLTLPGDRPMPPPERSAPAEPAPMAAFTSLVSGNLEPVSAMLSIPGEAS